MAETPFSSDSGAASAGASPEDGNQGTFGQPPTPFSPEPVPASAEPSEAAAAPEPFTTEPASSESASVSEPHSISVEQPTVASAFSEASAEVSPGMPAAEVPPQASSELPPGVAATITVPPLEAGESSGGGEWELLVERVTTWWDSGEPSRQWQRIRGPLKGVAILVAVLLAMQAYATVVRTIDAIPLVSGLLELAGLIAVLQFSATRLMRSSDRQEVLGGLQRRWLDFRGRQ